MDIRNIADQAPFITKDGSEIRELLAHRNSCIRRQTLAEARLPPGARTTRHHHLETEEIYYVLAGRGRMCIGDEWATVGPGDAIAIPPGHSHQLTNVGDEVLKFLCCCAGLRTRRHDPGGGVRDGARNESISRPRLPTLRSRSTPSPSGAETRSGSPRKRRGRRTTDRPA